jgi:hypothetical protein
MWYALGLGCRSHATITIDCRDDLLVPPKWCLSLPVRLAASLACHANTDGVGTAE